MNPIADKLQRYYNGLSPHIKERHTAKLILEAIQEINRLQSACDSVGFTTVTCRHGLSVENPCVQCDESKFP